MTEALSQAARAVQAVMRGPDEVMRLQRLGAGFQTRLSFMRSIVRRMGREGWRFERPVFDLDDEGYGTAVYTAITPERRYSLVCYSHYLEPERRTDRVIAEAWDATFTLFDGMPTDAEIARLAEQTPRQEAGRYLASDLVMSRANKSLRLFDHVVTRLSEGRQPDIEVVVDVGYLMRTTAVYGNGKFGMSDRTRYAGRPEVAGPFRAELLTVYMIRTFTLDLVEHVARRRNPASFVPLDRRIKRYLGIGNATGLGMAPFLVTHPRLIHNWFHAREAALAHVRAIDQATPQTFERFRSILARARRHGAEWRVADAEQAERIARLAEDLDRLDRWTAQPADWLSGARPWDALYRRAESAFSLEGQELLVSLLLEPHGALVDELGESLAVDDDPPLDPTMTVGALARLIERHYAWTFGCDFSDPAEARHFWYTSEEKLEPRRGVRDVEPGADKEMPLAVARDVKALSEALARAGDDESLAAFLMRHPALRAIARRVQLAARCPYGEIRDNLIGAGCRPMDMLRGKLAYFGASKFDPKSELWTRITMYQGAPLPDELGDDGSDDWCFPLQPDLAPCTSP